MAAFSPVLTRPFCTCARVEPERKGELSGVSSSKNVHPVESGPPSYHLTELNNSLRGSRLERQTPWVLGLQPVSLRGDKHSFHNSGGDRTIKPQLLTSPKSVKTCTGRCALNSGAGKRRSQWKRKSRSGNYADKALRWTKVSLYYSLKLYVLNNSEYLKIVEDQIIEQCSKSECWGDWQSTTYHRSRQERSREDRGKSGIYGT